MKPFVGTLLSVLLAFVAQAQVRFSSLDEILQFADKNSIVAQESKILQNISRKDEVINKSALLPRVGLFGTADYYPLIPSLVVPQAVTGGSPSKFQKVQFGLPWSFSSGVEVTIPVINFEKWEQLKRYKLQSMQTDLNTQVNLESLHIQLTQWYYQALLTHELVRLNRSNQEVTGELMRILEVRKQNGLLNPADYNRSRNLHLDIECTSIEYEKNYNQSLIALHQLLNLPDTSALQLLDSIGTKNWLSISKETAITNRPAWKEAELKIAVAQQRFKEAQKGALPSISLNSKYTYQWQLQPSSGQQINYDFSNIGLRIDFPLFQGNYQRASQQRTEQQLELAKLSEEQTAKDLGRQQSEWWNSYQAAVKKQAFLQEKLGLASTNLDIAKLNMKEGVMEFDEFNNIFQEYNKAKMDYLQNMNDGIVYQLLLTQK